MYPETEDLVVSNDVAEAARCSQSEGRKETQGGKKRKAENKIACGPVHSTWTNRYKVPKIHQSNRQVLGTSWSLAGPLLARGQPGHGASLGTL